MDNENEISGPDPHIQREHFTDEELEKIKNALTEKGFAEKPCNACRAMDRTIYAEPSSPQFLFWGAESNNFENFVVGPPFPSALVCCENCGNTWSFSLHHLGLMKGSIKFGKDDSQNG